MTASRRAAGWIVAIVVAVLAGCGGAGLATMSGTVTGLTQGTAVTLQINGGETLVVGGNGGFEFRDQLNANKNYEILIVGQPLNGHCTISNGTGHVDSNGKDIDNISVVCVPAFSVGGTIIGLPTGTTVTLNDGTEDTTYSADGVFTFPTQLPSGTAYNVTVTTQPTGHTCNVTNGSGTVGAVAVTNVVVTCS